MLGGEKLHPDERVTYVGQSYGICHAITRHMPYNRLTNATQCANLVQTLDASIG